MPHTPFSPPLTRAFDLLLGASLALAACHDDSTSPTPTASAITVSSGASQSGAAGTTLALPVVVKLTDANGNPVSGVAVTFTPVSGAGSVAVLQGIADSTGTVSASWTLGTSVGTDSLSVSATGAPSVVVTASVGPAPATAVTALSGVGQTAAHGSTLNAPIVVRVTDQYLNPVPNVIVQWSDDSNGSFSTPTTLTDANGLAAVVYTLGPGAGPETVSATIVTTAGPVAASIGEAGS